MGRLFKSYKGVLFLCFISYTTAYLCRLNISPALPAIQAELGLSDLQLGSITGAFFWVYALGQLFNGWLGCFVPSKIMVSVGLLGTAACNFAFCRMHTAVALMIIWGVNGIFQSMLWGPLLKALSNWCEPERLTRASFAMSVSCITGHALAGGFSGFMSARVSWRLCFSVPAIIAAAVGVLTMLFLCGEPEGRTNKESTVKEKPAQKKSMPLLRFILFANLPLLLILAIGHGSIKDGFNVWFPKILSETGVVSSENTWILLLVLPVISFGAAYLVRFFVEKFSVSFEKLVTVMMFVTAAVCLALYYTKISAAAPFLLLMVLINLLMMAVNPLLTSYIPFRYARYNYVSVVAGATDFAIYLGSALSGYVIGAIGDSSSSVQQSIRGISVFWIAAALVSAAVGIVLSSLNHKRERDAAGR